MVLKGWAVGYGPYISSVRIAIVFAVIKLP